MLEDIMLRLSKDNTGGDVKWTHPSVLNWPPKNRPIPLWLGESEASKPKLLHQWFEQRVQEYPERIAIDFLPDFETRERIQFTYQQVSDAATSLATTLRRASFKSNAVVKTVAVLIDPSPELYVSYIAALKAGLAFCPIPTDAPEERQRALLSDLKPVATLARESVKQDTATEIISVTSLLETGKDQPRRPLLPDSINETDSAYILYTSGTTGMPKGVTVSHISATCTISALSNHFGFSSQDTPRHDRQLRWFQGAAPTFDISLFEIFWTFSTGSTLCCAPRHLTMRNIDKVVSALEAGITNVTPSVASLINPSSIRAIMVGGEVLSPRLVQDFSYDNSSTTDASYVPRGIYNGYGPTEVTIYSVAQAHVPKSQRGSVVGTPLATCGALIVNSNRRNLEPVPMGAVGELVLTGPQVSKSGYLNRPEETTKAFVDDTKWGRSYRTGDRARIVWGENDEPLIEFLGRMSDDQIKLSGRRVELSEIESVLGSKNKDIQQLLACLWKPQSGASGSEKVVALLVVDPKSTLDFETVRSQCMEKARQRLPEYMIPFRILQVQSLPRSASGKIDRKAASQYVRKALQQLGNSKDEGSQVETLEDPEDVKLENKLLQLLAVIISDSPATESWLTAKTSLGEAGVDSLRAMRLLHAIRNQWPDLKSMQPPISLLLEPTASIRSVFFPSTTNGGAYLSKKMDKGKWRNVIDDFRSRNMAESLKQLGSISESDIAMILPLTSTQNQLAVNFAKNHRNYISHTVLTLKKEICLEALGRAINTVLDRHAIYRCALVTCNDDISPFAQVVLKREAWHEWTEKSPRVVYQQGKANTSLQHWLELAHQYLTLERQTFYYVQLVESAIDSEGSQATLVISVAHCFCDGASLKVLLSDISREYSGLAALPRLDIEHVVLEWISTVHIDTDKKWQALLKDWEAERFHALAGQIANATSPGLVAADYGYGMIKVSGGLNWQTFEARSRALGASPLSVLQASWSLLLYSLSEANTGEVVFGSVISGQYDATHAPTFSVVPCRVTLPDRETVQNLLQGLASASRFAQSHRNMSFGIFESLPYNTALALQSYSPLDRSLGKIQDMTATTLWDEIQTPAIRYDFDIFVEVFPIGLNNGGTQTENMSFKLTYRDDALSPTSAQVILDQLAAFTEVILSSSTDDFVQTLPSRLPRALLSAEGVIPMPTDDPAEKDRQLQDRFEVLHAQFENQAAATPDLLALSFYNSLDSPPTELTYAELDARANGLANVLREEDLDVIPICMRRGVELYVSILAILKAGSAWSPIDETLPLQRLTSLIARTEGKVILTTTDSFPLVMPCLTHESLAGVRVILADSYANNKTCVRANPRRSIQALRPAIEGLDLAYLLWTSGTTGEPKGVMIQHRAATNAMRDLQSQVEHEKGVPVRTLQLSAYSFDVFVQDLFYTWGLAGSVISGTRELVLGTFTEFVRKSEPTHAHLTPSFGASIDVEELRGSTLKTVTFIGEKLTEDVAEAWAAPGITARAYNTYGPAENAVVSTMRRFFGRSLDQAKAANVGFPLTPCTAYTVRNVANSDDSDKPQWELVPRYGVGELALGGAQVAKGYLKNEDKTTKAFIQGGPGIDERIYLTGDMVRLNDHGFEFLGRNDDLVKITGIRIELSEISAACATVKGEKAAVEHVETLYLPRPGGDCNYKVVVTFVSVKGESLDVGAIRTLIFRRARDLLPTYMVPGHVVVLDTNMPRTASNKVDRKALQSIYSNADLNDLAERDATAVDGQAAKSQWAEHQLPVIASITKSFKEPIETLGPEDSLAGLGFSSLQVTKLAWSLRRQIGCNVSVIDMMQCQTIGELVDAVQKSMEKTQTSDTSDTTASEASWVASLKENLTKSLHGESRPDDTSYILPATPFQESLLVETMIDPESYWSHRIFDLNHIDQVSSSRLKAAWTAAASQLDILRTVFPPLSEFSVRSEGVACTHKWASSQGISATILQIVLKKPRVRWAAFWDADVPSLATIAKQIQRDWASSAAKSSQPPWAVSFSEGNNKMMLSMHHALHDGASSSMLLNFVAKLYHSPGMTFDAISTPLQMSKGMELGLLPTVVERKNALSTWTKHMHSLVATAGALNAPFPDLTCSRKQGKGIFSARAVISDVLLEQPAGAPSLPQLLQSAFGCVLADILELKAVVFGQAISQRVIHPQLGQVMGPAMVTLPVAVRANASSAQQLWAEMGRDSLSLGRTAHNLHPVDIKKLVNMGSNQAQAPFPALFVYHPTPVFDAEHVDVGLEMFQEAGQAVSLNVEHPLALNIFEADNSIELSGNSRFISQPMLKLLLDQVLDQARTMLKYPNVSLDQLSNFMNSELISRTGQNETLVGIETAENPANLVTRWAAKHPTWLAAEELLFGDDDEGDETRIFSQTLSYIELEELVNAIATKLRDHEANLRPDDVVALYLRRDLKSLAAILAIFKCNYIYLPIEPDLPATRKQFIVHDADAKLVITTKSLVGDLDLGSDKAPPTVLLPESHDELDLIRYWPNSSVRSGAETGDGGYLLYTSGSTGRPKGVRVSNKNLLHFISAMTQRLTEANADTAHLGGIGKYLNVASRAFDTHLTSMFAPWHLGFCSAISKDRNDIFANLQQVINKFQITHMGSVPSVIAQLGLRLEDVPSMRVLTIGGEKASHELFDQLSGGNQSTALINFYGPTEVTVGCFAHKVGDHSNARNLGLPLRGLEAIILVPGHGDKQVIARKGQPGELCIAGPQVTIGYMNRPEENEKSFQYTSLLGGEKRIYRTGDIMRMMHDGTVEFLGRKDQQTKIRGQRFEIDEVVTFIKKAVADQGPLDVAAAVVDQRLIGFLARKSNTLLKAELDIEPEVIHSQSRALHALLMSVESACQEALPAFMVPEVLWVSKIPYLAASGKIDSKSLITLANESSSLQQVPRVPSSISAELASPLTPAESEIVAALEEVVGKKVLATSAHSMHNLGIDSLSGVHLMSILKKRGFSNVNLVDLVSPSCTIGSLSRMACADVHLDKSLTSTSVPVEEPSLDDIGSSANRLNQTNIATVLPCLPLQSSLVALSLNWLGSNEDALDADVPYVTEFIYELLPGTDVSRWKSVAEKVVAAEATLRTCFVQSEQDGQIFQIVLKSAPSPFHGQDDATSIVGQMDFRPPVRLRIQEEKTSGKTLVSLTVHHALYDGSAISTLRNRLERAYTDWCQGGTFDNQSLSDLKALSKYCHLDDEQTRSVRTLWQAKLRDIQPCLVGAQNSQNNPDTMVRLTRRLAYTTAELKAKLQHGKSVSMSTAFQLATVLCIAYLTKGRSIVYGFTMSLRPLLSHIVGGIDSFIGPCLNTIVHPLQLGSATETLPDLADRVHQIHEEVCRNKMPLVTADKIQRWAALEENLFDSILTINVVPESDGSASPHSASGHMFPLPGKSKTDLALAVDVDLHADGKIALSLSSAGILTEAQLESIGMLFENIVDSCANHAATVGQFVSVDHETTGSNINSLPNVSFPPPSPQQADGYFDAALNCVQSAACRLLRLDSTTMMAKSPETTSLYQLGLDSLNMFPFVKTINKLEGIKIMPNAAIRARTVQGVALLVAQAKRERDTIKKHGINEPIQTRNSVASQSTYEQTLRQVAGGLLFIATPLQEGMLSASMAIEDQAYTYIHTMQLSRTAREHDTPTFERFFAAVKDTVQDCEILRSRFIFTQNDEAPWVGVVSPTDQSDLVNWYVSKSGLIQLKIHHSLYDASSIQIIWRLLNENYRKRLADHGDDRPDDDPESYSFRPFAKSSALAQRSAVAFWINTVQDYKYQPIEIYNETSCASSASFITFDEVELSSLQSKCRTANVTLKAALQLAWAKVLCESLYKQPDVVFGEVISAGSDEDNGAVIGPTINTIPVRIKLARQRSAISIADALSHIQTLSDSARGTNGMASLRAIQTLWRSKNASGNNTPAELFQSLFVFDGFIDSDKNGAYQDLIVPLQSQEQPEMKYGDTGPAYDVYPFIVSFRITAGRLNSKLRAKTSLSKTQDLVEKLGAALRYLASEELQSSALGSAHLHLKDGSWGKALESTVKNTNDGDQVPILNGSVGKADAVLRIARKVVGEKISGGQIRFDAKLVNIGLDSISAIRFSRALRKELGIHASVFEIIKGASARDIVEKSTSVQSNGVKKSTKPSSLQDLESKGSIAKRLKIAEHHIKSIVPALPGQLWTLKHWLHCGKRFFEAPRAYRVRDESIDVKRVARYWAELCRVHETLRTTLVDTSKSSAMQVILDESIIVARSLTVVQDGTITVPELIEKHVRDGNNTPSDLTNPPVLLSFLEACDGKAVVLRVHHALYDSWNIKLILKDLVRLFSAGSLPHYPSLHHKIQEINNIRQPEAEKNYWKKYLANAQDTIVQPGDVSVNDSKNPMRPHFRIVYEDSLSHSISNTLFSSMNSKSYTSVAIILAYGRTLAQLTGCSQPTFWFNHSSRSLESPSGEHTIDLTDLSFPTMTVTPLTVDMETPSKQQSFEAVRGHLAQLTRFAQAENLESLAPKSNSTINIIYPEGNDEGHTNVIEKEQGLYRHKLNEPVASDYFTNTIPSLIASTVDGLDTSLMHAEQLYFNVSVFPNGNFKISVSGVKEILRGDERLVDSLIKSFVNELSGLMEK